MLVVRFHMSTDIVLNVNAGAPAVQAKRSIWGSRVFKFVLVFAIVALVGTAGWLVLANGANLGGLRSLQGQPNQDCADFPNTPGQSVNAPGSAFNPEGHAGTVYAGQQPQNSQNPNSVSQYDVACSKQPTNP